MKSFILCLIIICVFPAVILAETPRSENEQGDTPRSTELSPQIEQENKQTPKDQLHWPRPYVPSEEISADSIVPFPADI